MFSHFFLFFPLHSWLSFPLLVSVGTLQGSSLVPFRMTPNISTLLAPLNDRGPLAAAMVATARALVDPTFAISNYLHAVLKDEVILWHRRVCDYSGP